MIYLYERAGAAMRLRIRVNPKKYLEKSTQRNDSDEQLRVF
jgi:hypothetical protein